MIADGAIAASAIAGSAEASAAPETFAYGLALPATVFVVATRNVSVQARVHIVDVRVFDYDGGCIEWAPIVSVGGIDISARICGRITISADEEAARVASFTFMPASPADLDTLESAPVVISVSLFNGLVGGIWPRFTGIIERREDFDPATRTVTVHCRDGYQERIKACASAADVEALLGGQAYSCPALLPWSDDTPDPTGYFDGLIATLPGSAAIDSSGTWRVIPWSFGAAAASFGADDVFDGSLRVTWPDRANQPKSVDIALTVRVNRLHCAELPISWAGLSYYRVALDACEWPTKALIADSLSGLDGWSLSGPITYGMLTPGAYPVIHGGSTTYLLISYQTWQSSCNSFSATLKTRWYQSVDVVYKGSIMLGGESDRGSTVSASLASTWPASEWESGASSSTDAAGIYADNAPTGSTGGGAILPGPHPPGNAAIDYYPDLSGDAIAAAVVHVAAKATRLAAQGFRERRVTFERVIDPRWELGAVLAVSVDGVSARGQVMAFEDALDCDTGDISTQFTLACPAGSGTALSFAATVALPSASVAHSLPPPALGNHIGASDETLDAPDDDTILGMLTNVSIMSGHYQPAKPVYISQFRVVMPEIGEAVRDPIKVEQAISLAVNFPAGELSIAFT